MNNYISIKLKQIETFKADKFLDWLERVIVFHWLKDDTCITSQDHPRSSPDISQSKVATSYNINYYL